jgi:hypothetical protein
MQYDPNYSYDEADSSSGGSTDIQVQKSTSNHMEVDQGKDAKNKIDNDDDDSFNNVDDFDIEEDNHGWSDADNDQDLQDHVDEDDNTWKVRRSAIRCLSAVIRTRPDIVKGLYRQLLHAFIIRFKERDRNVKAAVFSATADLIRETTKVSRLELGDLQFANAGNAVSSNSASTNPTIHATSSSLSSSMSSSSSSLSSSPAFSVMSESSSQVNVQATPPFMLVRAPSSQTLSDMTEMLITHAMFQLTRGQVDVKIAILAIFVELVSVVQTSGKKTVVESVMPYVLELLESKDSNAPLKSASLQVVRKLVEIPPLHSFAHSSVDNNSSNILANANSNPRTHAQISKESPITDKTFITSLVRVLVSLSQSEHKQIKTECLRLMVHTASHLLVD